MTDLKTIKIVNKPWGEERIYALTDKYIGKILYVKAGQRLSKQFHKVKDETLLLFEGKATIEFEGERSGYLKMNVNYPIRILPGTVHRITAITDCKILEASTSEIDDVVRLEDDYQRI